MKTYYAIYLSLDNRILNIHEFFYNSPNDTSVLNVSCLDVISDKAHRIILYLHMLDNQNDLLFSLFENNETLIISFSQFVENILLD